MNGFSFLCLAIALGLGVRVLRVYANSQGMRDERRMEYERHQNVVRQDPTNASSYAHLAQMLFEDNHVDDAVMAWRRAINLMPQGPFTTKWKRDLKRALEVQATLARGEKPLEQKDVRICPRCEAIVPNAITTCPNCGEILHLSFANTLAQTEVRSVVAQRNAHRERDFVDFRCCVVSPPARMEGRNHHFGAHRWRFFLSSLAWAKSLVRLAASERKLETVLSRHETS